jgi:hypothetical protein
MKKFIKWAAIICIPLVSAYAYTTTWVGSLTDGYHIGTASTQRLGFFGAVPTMQPANTVSAYSALVIEGLIASGGTDPSQTAATNPIKHVTVTLSAAQINALYDTPVALVPAGGAGHTTSISKVIFAITRTSTAFASGGAVIIQYASTVHGGGTQACDSTLASTVVTGASGLSNSQRNGAVISDSAATDNAGVYISNQTGDFTTGTGTAVVDVWYYQN